MYKKRKHKWLVTILVCILGVIGLCGCNGRTEPVIASGYALNTFVSVKIYGMEEKKASEIAKKAVKMCSEYEIMFSRTLEESELYKLNSGEISKVSEELYRLIELGAEWGDRTEGAFNMGIGAVSSLWNFTSEPHGIPNEKDIEEALKIADYKDISLNGEKSFQIETNGVIIDLGAFAKGYIADRIKYYLISEGVESAIIDLGGNILCLGGKRENTGLSGKTKTSNFLLAIQKPFAENGEVVANVRLNDMALVTSGCYERYFIQNDTLYHHILDPETGYPVENELLSVTIITDNSVEADILSTACYVMGLEKGKEFIESLEGAYAVFITEDYEVHFSEGASQYVELIK